jgi:hypothetical protein
MASRLLVAVGQHMELFAEGWDRFLIVVPPLIVAVLLGNMVGASHHGRPRFGLMAMGFVLGPVLPTLLAVVFRHVAPSQEGTAFGLLFAAGALGSMFLGQFMSIRTTAPLHYALRLPIFLALLVTALALVLGLMTP